MKNTKKLLALLMCSALATSMFVGCGNKDSAEKGKDSDKDAEEVIEMDLGGRTIRYAAWYSIAPVPGADGYDEFISKVSELEEKYNFKLEWVELPANDYPANIQTANLAGTPPAEILIVNDGHFTSLLNSDSLYPISDSGYLDLNEEHWEDLVTEFSTKNKKVYGVDAGVSDPRIGVYFNKEHFRQANIPDPYELMEKGEWTWDVFYDYAKKLTKDTNGDGVPEQYGIGYSNEMISNLVYSNGGKIIDPNNGDPKFTLDKPEAIEALNFYEKLVRENLIKLRPEGGQWDWGHTAFQDGEISMMADHAYLLGTFSQGAKDDYGFVLLPKGPKAKNYVHPCPQIDMRVIPSRVEKPEEVAFVLNELMKPYEGQDPDEWKEGRYPQAKDKETVDLTLAAMRDPKITIFTSLVKYGEAYKTVEQLFGDITRLEKTPAAAIEAYKSQIEAEMKK